MQVYVSVLIIISLILINIFLLVMTIFLFFKSISLIKNIFKFESSKHDIVNIQQKNLDEQKIKLKLIDEFEQNNNQEDINV